MRNKQRNIEVVQLGTERDLAQDAPKAPPKARPCTVARLVVYALHKRCQVAVWVERPVLSSLSLLSKSSPKERAVSDGIGCFSDNFHFASTTSCHATHTASAACVAIRFARRGRRASELRCSGMWGRRNSATHPRDRQRRHPKRRQRRKRAAFVCRPLTTDAAARPLFTRSLAVSVSARCRSPARGKGRGCRDSSRLWGQGCWAGGRLRSSSPTEGRQWARGAERRVVGETP